MDESKPGGHDSLSYARRGQNLPYAVPSLGALGKKGFVAKCIVGFMQSGLQGVFKPETQTVRDIFDGIHYYQVPDYQRPYSWGAEQVEQLWDDLYEAWENNEDLYFLGPVILNETKDDRLEIIDGQQRLTSLTVLFCVLRDHFRSALGKSERPIENAIKSLVDNIYRLRLVTQAHYQNQFEQEILDRVNLPPETSSRSKPKAGDFLSTAGMFHKKLSNLDDRRLEKFISYILNQVVMITITCSSRASAIRLFQVINTRGLNLSNADLIKSHLYGKLGEKEVSKFMRSWTQVETLAKHLDESLTSLFTLYEYYLLASNPRKTLYEELEKQFKRYLKGDSNRIIFDFQKFCEGYDQILNMALKPVFALRYLPNQVFWKSILATAHHVGFSDDDLHALSKELRRFYYSYWIAGYTTSKIKQPSFNIIRWLKERRSVANVGRSLDKKMEKDDVEKWMEENLRRDDVYSRSWLKPSLLLVEYAQTDESKLTFLSMDRKLHVDHILPQGWNRIHSWRDRWDRKEASRYLNSIGNMTLLSGRKNIQASNSPLAEKKAIYKGKGKDGTTAFLISQRMTRNRVWAPRNVQKRASWLIDEIKGVIEDRDVD